MLKKLLFAGLLVLATTLQCRADIPKIHREMIDNIYYSIAVDPNGDEEDYHYYDNSTATVALRMTRMSINLRLIVKNGTKSTSGKTADGYRRGLADMRALFV